MKKPEQIRWDLARLLLAASVAPEETRADRWELVADTIDMLIERVIDARTAPTVDGGK